MFYPLNHKNLNSPNVILVLDAKKYDVILNYKKCIFLRIHPIF